MAKVLRFPVDRRLFYCDYCGASFENFVAATRCDMRRAKEEALFLKGSEVSLWQPDYAGKRLHPQKRVWRIKELYYTQPGESVFNFGRHDGAVEPHTLAVKLEQTIGENARAVLTITQQDLLLWHEGSTEKLKAAGLLSV